MLKNLEANPKDLEKERARLRAVRRGPPGAGLVMAASAKARLAALRRWRRWRVGGAAARRAPAASSFSASIDRPAVAPDQPFVYRVTLSTTEGQPEGFKPPDFRGLRVLGGPFMQTGINMVMGGGGAKVENNVTWSYQLAVPPGRGAGGDRRRARARRRPGAGVECGAGARRRGRARPRPRAPAARPGLFPRGLFGDEPTPRSSRSSSSASAAFLRAVADKRRAFVGEQVTVTWYLYLAEPQSNFQPMTQPKADGFWGRRSRRRIRRGGSRSPTRSRAGSTTRSRSSCSARCFRSRPAS